VDKNIGLSAGIIALLALAAHVAVPTAGERTADQAENGAKTKKSKAPPAGRNTEPENYEGPWFATRHFFMPYGPPRPPKISSSRYVDLMNPEDIRACSGIPQCLSELRQFFGVRATVPVQCLLATVPDPNHTRLALFTDHNIEAIWKGAGAAGWEFAAQWLPWNDAVDPEEGDPAERARERRYIRAQETQPGALVFRHSVRMGNWGLGGLVIFLVGETPTAGVNAGQFQIARAYMNALGTANPVKIDGPTFSGSFDSLAFLIRQDSEKQPGMKYQVRSGTAQSQDDALAFEDRVRAGTNIEIDFHSATQNIDYQDRRFRDVLNELGILPDHPDQAAIVAEDESTFGTAASAPSGPPGSNFRTFRFPRDISHLRDTYRQAQQAAKPANGSDPGLDFSLKDPSVGEDSVPTYSQTQTPIAQNAVINEIARAIRRFDIRIVEVSGTNVLDLLFVAGALRRQCPNTRLLFQNADLLVVQAEQTQALNGALLLSSYPLFAESRACDRSGEIRVFSDGPSQGVFNATVLLLTGSAPTDGSETPPKWKDMPDYARQSTPYPRDWLLTLDRQGFMPVRVWDNDATERWFEPAPGMSGKLTFANLPRPPALTLLASVFSALGIALGIWIFRLHRIPDWQVDARLEPLTANDSWHGFYLLLFLSILMGIQVSIFVASPRVLHWPPQLIAALGFLLPAGVAIRYCRPGSRRKYRLALSTSAVALLSAVGLWSFCCRGQASRSYLFSIRAAELRFGSSPLWPVVAAVAALLLWCFIHLTRLYFASCGQPDAVTDGIGVLKGQLKKSYEDFEKSAKSWLGLFTPEQQWGLSLAALAATLLFFLLRVNVQLGSIDGWPYDTLCITLQVLVAGLLLLTSWHIHSFWKSLHRFTTNLELLPLAHAFVRVGPASGNRPIWVKHSTLLSLEVHTNSVMLLHDMSLQPEELKRRGVSLLPFYNGLYRSALVTLLDSDHPLKRYELHAWHHYLWRLSNIVSTRLLPALRQAWADQPLFERMTAEPSPKESQDQDPQTSAFPHRSGAPAEPESITPLAEKFVALHYTPFLLYAVRQIQNLLWLPSVGFVLLMLSMNSYNFQSPRWIGTFLLILFAAITLTVGACMVQMERDPILSHIAGTKPGQLGAAFYLRIAQYGALPILGLLAHQFPSISNTLLSGVQPALEALK
jgi:hypothetical protein